MHPCIRSPPPYIHTSMYAVHGSQHPSYNTLPLSLVEADATDCGGKGFSSSKIPRSSFQLAGDFAPPPTPFDHPISSPLPSRGWSVRRGRPFSAPRDG
ncbi:hypothetical protein AVEN_241449-1 [Araneus ventricosus]|uniref:Uncharacterized protein n=1 Tax=Araneus ventricosus TaxID=182803 RepID=A0A4Y2FZT6_ARAVE|nr:hypothetical protein AVEN_241449-1 [Araneus ventricosus]